MCETKKCIKCLEVKSLIEFNKNKTKKSGVASLCKLCHSEYRKEHYLKNKDKVIEQVKTWKEYNFSESILFEKYGDVIFFEGFNKKSNCVCETNCHECGKQIARKKIDIDSDIKFNCNECRFDPKISFIKTQIRNAKRRSIIKMLEFNINYDDLLKHYKSIDFKCEITKVNFSFDNLEKNIMQPSLDRIDSNMGYTIGNIQIVCLGYNYMKNSFNLESVNTFLNLLKNNK
jgi:hypothetical protein